MNLSDWSSRWPSFTLAEVLSDDQLKLFKSKGVFPYSFKALDKLQDFRNFIDAPLLINHGGSMRRAARSMKDVYEINRETRGKERGWEYSFHLWCAFDLTCPGKPSTELFSLAKDFGLWGGIGLYDTFVHCDDRSIFGDSPTTWDFRTKK